MSLFTTQEKELLQKELAKEPKSLSPEILSVLHRHKIFKLFIAKELGGSMLPLSDALKVFDECAYIDGNIGWAAGIGSGGNYFAGYYSEAVAKRLFSAENAVLAGSGYPGMAKKTEGGYLVSGSWKYCSGAGYATFYTANALIEGENRMIAFSFMPEQVKIVEDWNATGLKATESNTMVVENAFVPHELTFDLSKPVSYLNEPVYSFPFLQFAQLSFAAVVLGIYRAYVDEARGLQNQNPHATNNERNTHLEKSISDEENRVKEISLRFYQTAQTAWENHLNETEDKEALEAVSAITDETSSVAGGVSTRLLPFLGMAAVMETSRLNKIYRDLITANQHVLLKPFPFGA